MRKLVIIAAILGAANALGNIPKGNNDAEGERLLAALKDYHFEAKVAAFPDRHYFNPVHRTDVLNEAWEEMQYIDLSQPWMDGNDDIVFYPRGAWCRKDVEGCWRVYASRGATMFFTDNDTYHGKPHLTLDYARYYEFAPQAEKEEHFNAVAVKFVAMYRSRSGSWRELDFRPNLDYAIPEAPQGWPVNMYFSFKNYRVAKFCVESLMRSAEIWTDPSAEQKTGRPPGQFHSVHPYQWEKEGLMPLCKYSIHESVAEKLFNEKGDWIVTY